MKENAFILKLLFMFVIVISVMCANTVADENATPLPTLRSSSPELFPGASPDSTRLVPNLWDGVDDNNNICVFVNQTPVLDDVGRMQNTRFPPSPNFVDINNNGLKDLVVGDSYGFVWVYLNSGEPGKPKFTTGKFLNTFIGWNSRLHVADWNQNGLYDLIIGTHYGDIVIFENTGTSEKYTFNRTMGIPRYVDPRHSLNDPRAELPQVRLGRDPLVLGIYKAPWVIDWNNNQRPDLLWGEGTYSANSVRIAFNRGPRGRPTFVEDSVFFLAFGEGYEQLTPAIVDYNGDGINDLIVGTRTGEIRLYKGTQDSTDPTNLVAALRSTLAPAVLEFDRYLEIEGREVWDTMTYIHPCDWNDNGLFDLLLSSTRGRIYIAINEGTKTEPHFPKAVPIKGTDTRKDVLAPSAWYTTITSGPRHPFYTAVCNAAMLLTSEKEVAIEPDTPPVKPVEGERFMYFRYIAPVGEREKYLGWTRHGDRHVSGGRNIRLRPNVPLEIGKRYEFSFYSILRGSAARWNMRATEMVEPATDARPAVTATRNISNTLTPSSSWQKRTYTFTCPGHHTGNTLNFGLWLELAEGDSILMLDNFSLKEIGR